MKGVLDGSHEGEGHSLASEWQSALLLVILYMIQGVPLGLSMGSMCVFDIIFLCSLLFLRKSGGSLFTGIRLMIIGRF